MLEVEKVLVKTSAITKKVRQLARRISRDFQNKNPLLICVLKGAVVFLSDLIRNLEIPLEIDFIQLSSYGVGTKSSGKIKIKKDIDVDIVGKDVLIVEDIVDTGLTIDFLIKNLKERKPKSIKLCALLDKPSRRKVKVKIDYKGFSVPDKFIVGYGLDFAEKYRNLPYIGVLKK